VTVSQIDLEHYHNNVGITDNRHRERGDFDGFGRSFPFEDLSHLVGLPDGLAWSVDGSGRPDNIACEGQVLTLPKTTLMDGWIVLGATEGGSFLEPFVVVDAESRHLELPLGFTDWLAPNPRFGEMCRVLGSHLHERQQDLVGPRPRLWCATLTIGSARWCGELRLPVNPSLHIFTLALINNHAES
jgi:alpha-L-fucosidase 2